MHIYIIFNILSIMAYCRILNIVTKLYSRTCYLFILYIEAYLY